MFIDVVCEKKTKQASSNITEELFFVKYLGNAYNNAGTIYNDVGEPERAFEYHKKAQRCAGRAYPGLGDLVTQLQQLISACPVPQHLLFTPLLVFVLFQAAVPGGC